ncbi:MAG: methionine adenosyltransferase [Deltaproteobacteria bacterium]|nr:methionine adenosyltransferase [Deltaproteobacteria bacterium]
MSDRQFLFTSESVTEGHPDKICDQISDACLDAILTQDPKARVAIETMVATGFVHLAGEVTTTAKVDFTQIIRETLAEIGYTHVDYGMDANSCAVLVSIGKQSPDIAQGVNEGDGMHKELGAGDQGLMFGYACDENEELMPNPIYYAHQLTRQLAKVRKDQTVPFFRPDGKAQVTFVYKNDRPVAVDTIVLSTQHDPDIEHEEIVTQVKKHVIEPVFAGKWITEATKFYINPTGNFVIGGPHGDAGLTGRKIIVDTYGGWGRHGGGAFSGKDATKVDRSASYAARYIAKNIVASGVARICEVQLAYAIGVADPVSISLDTFGTSATDAAKLEEMVRELFPLKPKDIIEKLDLQRPVFQKTASYGHFGRGKDQFTWEKTDQVEAIKNYLKIV